MRTLVLIASGALVLALGVYTLNSCIPFSLAYVKRAKAQHLRDDVKEWQMLSSPESFGRTNQTDTSYLWRTNMVAADVSISTVMRLDSSLFRNRGYLVATSNREVIWVGRDGRAEAMSPK
ncbi:MAG: hypothetical protein GYA76_08785 [Verrucomicrobia bacterium]|jgi:hypothetical protein|nr:hypothetical protein [Verrucomicrobiota bacterium]HQI32429.1 hypothetical protein [Verrucomicrobiota bacterium]